MNYTITNEWQTLQTIMDTDYDATKEYRLHNNCELPGKLCLTEEASPTSNTIGRIYPAYCDIYIEAGLNPKLRVISGLGVNFAYNVEISEISESEGV